MDSIKHAVELARAAERAPVVGGSVKDPPAGYRDPEIREVRLNDEHLQSARIVAQGSSRDHGHYYDMLRTQVLQEMDKKSYQFLAVTSPTAGCGKAAARSARHSAADVGSGTSGYAGVDGGTGRYP